MFDYKDQLQVVTKATSGSVGEEYENWSGNWQEQRHGFQHLSSKLCPLNLLILVSFTNVVSLLQY